MSTGKIVRLVLIISLVSIGAFSVTSQQDRVLTPDATIDEIVLALETAHEQYETIHVKIVEYDHLNNSVMTDEIWLSQPEGAYHWEFTSTSAEGEVFESLEVNNGEYIYMSNGVGGQPLVLLAATEPAFITKGLGLVTTVIAPEFVAKKLIEPQAQVEIIGVEMVNERETIKVIYMSKWRTMNLWVDTETGILLQHELWSPEGELVNTVVVEAVEFDPVFEDAETLFYVDSDAFDPDRVAEIFAELESGFSQEP